MDSLLISVVFFGSQFIGRSASGTAQVTYQLIKKLITEHKDTTKVHILLKNLEEYTLVRKDPSLENCNLIILPRVKFGPLKSSRQYYKFIRTYPGEKFDILHFMTPRLYPFFWKFPAKKFVCTFHAAGDLTVPIEKLVISRHIYNLIAKRYWKNLSAIYSVSELGSKEISDFYGIPLNKISQIFIGTDSFWQVKSKAITPFEKKKFKIVIVGRWQTYKNVHSILWAIYNSKTFDLENYMIFLIGKSNQLGKNEVNRIYNKFPYRSIIKFDYVSNENLKYLYSTADLVIHPSINEGFGLPAFEAFGEGSKILVHYSTPAAMYLSKFKGVLVDDLLNQANIVKSIHRGLKVKKVSKYSRRKYLVELDMTWSTMACKYQESYSNLLSTK
jgi:glycosyltransferase involved in cell wall biosynthesis